MKKRFLSILTALVLALSLLPPVSAAAYADSGLTSMPKLSADEITRLLAASEFSHTPKKPADMDEAFYKQGYSATSSSNISAGSSLVGSVDSFMEDSDSGNISRVGHRRWQLNPTLGKVGFGYAFGGGVYGRYGTEKVFDRSGAGGDYTFIAWPASGYFPNSVFDGNYAWSASVNPEKYETPAESRLTVTLRRESDGKTWTFSGGKSYSASGKGEYFHVDTGGYGISNCIIFRPDGVSRYEGVYTVTIDGLKAKGGSDTSLSYQVNFFAPRRNARADARPDADA